MIHESKAVQIHGHNTLATAYMCLGCLVATKICTKIFKIWLCISVSQVPGSVKILPTELNYYKVLLLDIRGNIGKLTEPQ